MKVQRSERWGKKIQLKNILWLIFSMSVSALFSNNYYTMAFNLESVNNLAEACAIYEEAYEDATAFAEKWQITIEEINDLVLPELKEKIISLKEGMMDSLNYNCGRINEANMKLPWIDEEIQRLQSLKKSYQTEIERRKSWMKFCMESVWMDKAETDLNKLSFRTTEQVVVIDWTELPDEYLRIKKEPDKTKIKEAIKWGAQIDWCGIIQNHNLIIK